MKNSKPQMAALAVLLLINCAAGAQLLVDPIPEPLQKRGLSVAIETVARLPDTRDHRAHSEDVSPTSWARVSYVRDLPDGRRFANDSRGLLYLLTDNEPSVYLDFGAEFPQSFYGSLESGFIGFEFHPEFADNGLFYTTHGEFAAGNPATPDFIPPGFSGSDVSWHNVVTQWRAQDPSAAQFSGSKRELLRIGHVVDSFFHIFSHLGFNPTATPGDADYGLLYTTGTDFAFSNGGGPNAANPSQTQRLDSIVTAMLRIDPRSPAESRGVKGIGDYTIPPVNHFAADGDPDTLGEIYAYGFRNAHRMSWDTDGTLYASDIGMSQIEEINIVHEARNYGWMQREGTFDNGINTPDRALNFVYPLPPDILDGSRADEYTYPVAMYDHSEGQAITGGYPYRGRIDALRGKFVFGDLVRGRLFAADIDALKAADDGIPQTTAPIEEIQLYVRDANGERRDVELIELIEEAIGIPMTRADMQVHRTLNGELLISSRQDGIIRMLVAD